MENSENNEKLCWICFGTSEEDETAQWVKPCKCKGTMKWVHQKCLQLWVCEKRKKNVYVKVQCTQCNTGYLVEYSPIPFFVLTLESFSARVLYSPFGPFLIGTVFITAAPTVDESLCILLCTDPSDPMTFVRTIAFPGLCLLYTSLVKLENKIVQKLADRRFGIGECQPVNYDSFIGEIRLICTVLCLPVMSKIVGNLFERCIDSPFRRCLLGMGLLLTANTSVGVYFKYQKLLCSRQVGVILDYKENVAQIQKKK